MISPFPVSPLQTPISTSPASMRVLAPPPPPKKPKKQTKKQRGGCKKPHTHREPQEHSCRWRKPAWGTAGGRLLKTNGAKKRFRCYRLALMFAEHPEMTYLALKPIGKLKSMSLGCILLNLVKGVLMPLAHPPPLTLPTPTPTEILLGARGGGDTSRPSSNFRPITSDGLQP